MRLKQSQSPKLQPTKPSFWGNGGRPIMIAHRGGDAAGADKENTLEAFQAAWDLGYKYAETDVITATSGELVAIHGSHNWVQAATKRDITRKTLQKMSLDQIQAILKPGGAKVPTLEELLTGLPDMKFFIDLKTDEAVVPLINLIKRLKAFDRIRVAGFGYQRNLRYSQGAGTSQSKACLTIGRGLRFKNINMLLLKTGHLSDVEAIFMHHSLVSRPMLDLVHRKGFKAIIWTANSSVGIKHALKSGADGVISDRVQLLKEVIEIKK